MVIKYFVILIEYLIETILPKFNNYHLDLIIIIFLARNFIASNLPVESIADWVNQNLVQVILKLSILDAE
jgi:hypothetical protein